MAKTRRSKAPLPETVDFDDVETALHELDKDQLVALVGDLLGEGPAGQHARLLDGYVDVRAIAARAAKIHGSSPAGFVEGVREFSRATLAEEHREGFNVNSRNYREQSDGTRQWIDLMRKHLDRAVQLSEQGHHHEAVEALTLLLDLLEGLDNGEDYIFFADEAGSWQVGVHWDAVLAAYFRSLAATASPDDYADAALALAESRRHENVLAAARKTATKAQQAALRSRG